jgi:F0F1-type ATP synthase assembly protein I
MSSSGPGGPSLDPSRGQPESRGPTIADLLTLGISAAVAVGLGLAVGWFLDAQLDTLPLCTMIGLGLGVVLAVATVWAQMRKFLQQR